MGFKAVINFVAGDHYTGVANKVAKSTKRIADSVKKAGDNAKKSTKKFKDLGESMKKMGQKVSIAGAGIVAFGALSVKKSADIESMRIRFNKLTGSVEKGGQALKEVIAFTATTPFQLEGVANVASTMIQAFDGTEGLTKRLRLLGDVATGMGQPIEDVARPFIKAKANKFSLEILNNFLEKQLVLWPVLEKSMGKPRVEIEKMFASGKVTFAHLEEALGSLTVKGGKFHKMTEAMSLSMNGLLSTMKDNANFAMAAIGDQIIRMAGLDKIFADIIIKLNEFSQALPEWSRENPGWAKFIGILLTMIIVLGPLMMVFGQMIIMMAAMKWAVLAMAPAFTIGFWPLALIVIGIIALVAAGVWLSQNWDAIVYSMNMTIQTLIDSFNSLRDAGSNAWDWWTNLTDITGGTHQFEGKLSSQTENRSEIAITLNDPAGSIKEVESNTAPGTELNTGVMP
jgi:hypothetical protein